ncbi:MAG TPA: hypothetical protein VF784_10485 [Anaerolineales bacterium]
MNNGTRYQTLGFKLTEDWIDVSYQAQERAVKLSESYLKVFQDGQKSGFDLVLSWMKHMQELQTLSFGYLQESARTGNEILSGFVRVQDEVRKEVKDRFDHQVTEIEKVAKVTK